MMYVSTRGEAQPASFEEVLLGGLAPDGGLYLPAEWPTLSGFDGCLEKPYARFAAEVLSAFTGENPGVDELTQLTAAAYATFDTPKVAPLKEVGPGLFLLELFHGPTLAFKDVAMQVLSQLMERALKRGSARAMILGATSGDTGAAAVEAFRGRADMELFILYPHGRISDVQRRQMTTAREDNVHIIAVEGTFDDAQAIVKSLFADPDFRARHHLCAINSINWARIMAQAVYYFTAWAGAGKKPATAFCVPTGNFGDVFAGFLAHKMGLPLGRLVVATNENDILARALNLGVYEPREVCPTDSPSMDIQVSSNFERLLFESVDRNAMMVRNMMTDLARKGRFELGAQALAAMGALFSAHSVTRQEAAAAMGELYATAGYLMDPHTAVGYAACQKQMRLGARDADTPHVVLATAHPAKFPEAVHRATGVSPELPARFGELMAAKERFTVLAASADSVARHIQKTSAFSS